MEKITYLVTNYNNGHYIKDCLESIVNQKNKNWCCLVIDDASTDNSVQLIKAYESEKLKLVRNSFNIDQVKSLQKLIEISETDIVAIVDSDDALHPEVTDYILNAFNTNQRIGFVYTNSIEYDELLKKPVSIGLVKRIPFGPTSSIVFGHPGHIRCFRKSTYEKTTGYDTSLLYAEDLDLGYKLEEVCLPYFVNKYLYLHRRVEDTRGRKLKNKLLGYKNRMIAKNNAIERRKIRGFLKYLCKAYVYLEYKKCVNSKKGNKIQKNIYHFFMRLVKNKIDGIEFKIIVY